MIPNGLLPAGTKWCIAGGYAACPALAGDIDVWVYGVHEIARGDIGYRRDELLNHLLIRKALLGWEVTPSYETIDGAEYDSDQIQILKVATVDFCEGTKPIHLMVTDAESINAILAGFDVSTHQIAIEPGGRIHLGPGWTPPQVPPVALLNNTNTPERMRRIAARFQPLTPPQPPTFIAPDEVPF